MANRQVEANRCNAVYQKRERWELKETTPDEQQVRPRSVPAALALGSVVSHRFRHPLRQKSAPGRCLGAFAGARGNAAKQSFPERAQLSDVRDTVPRASESTTPNFSRDCRNAPEISLPTRAFHANFRSQTIGEHGIEQLFHRSSYLD